MEHIPIDAIVAPDSTVEPDPIVEIARTAFGVSYLYPYQRLVVANVLGGGSERRAQIVVLPTGSGKTLCFTLPALVLDGLTVVVYPLLALMADQLRRMEEAGIPTRVLRGGQPAAERRRILQEIRTGNVRCVLTNPEVLSVDAVAAALSEVHVAHFVVDEAHCVSEWGETFRPSYLTLADSVARLDPGMTTAFTATASPLVLSAVQRLLFPDGRAHLIQGDPDRPNITYHRLYAESKNAALGSLVREMKLPALVFCRSRKRVESVARELAASLGPDRCTGYHAGLDREERTRIERWFFRSGDGVLAATCAYGLGVDKPDIRTVIHFELPSSVESFLQESGRGGRDRGPATSIVLWNAEDKPREREPVRAARESIMFGYLATPSCLRTYLLEALGAEPGTCFGCDHCTDIDPVPYTRMAVEAARDSMRRFVRRNARRFTFDETVRRAPLGWIERHRQELLQGMIDAGEIVLRRRLPWKWRLEPSRRPAPRRADHAAVPVDFTSVPSVNSSNSVEKE